MEILDAPRIGGGIRHAAEILRAYLDEHQGERLVEYALRLGNRAVLYNTLGFLLESQGWGAPELIAACRVELSSGISLLDPDGPRLGPRRAGMAAARRRGARTAGAVVIAKQELMRLRGEWQLDVGVIEKDYVLGWVLAAISAESALADTWIFKGGTCLRKCYYETYRFSEDLEVPSSTAARRSPTR